METVQKLLTLLIVNKVHKNNNQLKHLYYLW